MAEKMRALKLKGPKKLAVVETETPQPDGHNVIIKVSFAGICGTDLHFWEAGGGLTGKEDLIMGHEFSGTVEDPGMLKDAIKRGDNVSVIPLDPCGECPACKRELIGLCPNVAVGPGVEAPGGFAEYFSARPDMVRKLPEGMRTQEGAMLEPSCVSLHAVRLAGIKPGDKVLVIGGGIIGLLCATWARIAGASFIALTETNALRAAKARDMGDVDAVLDGADPELAAQLLEASKGGFDQALDCSGTAPGVNSAIAGLKIEGKLVLVGINYEPLPLEGFSICLKELTLKGDLGYTTQEFDQAIEMAAKGYVKTERFVSDIVDLDGAEGAFERLTSGKAADVKILIRLTE